MNLDFEPIPLSQRANFVTFVGRLRSAFDARRSGLELTFDATRREWLAGYDLQALTAPGAADAVFLMGYEYSSGGATRSGASAPIRRVPGSLGPVRPYDDDDLRRTLEAYLDQAVPGKVILGLPWYGRSWSTETDSFPSPTRTPGSEYGKSGT